MVDPYQATKLIIIDNGINNNSMCSNDQLFTINSTKNMNESNRLIQQQQQQHSNKQTLETNTNACNSNSDKCGTNDDGNDIESVITNRSETINWNNVNERFSRIMCGPSSHHGMNTNETSTKSTSAAVTTPTQLDICQNHQRNGDGDINETLIGNNLNAYHQRDIDSETENSNQVCVIVNKTVQKTESNDSTGNTNRLLSSTTTTTTATTATTQKNNDSTQHSIASQSNWKSSSLQLSEQQIAATITTMDSRKVEPLRININREPIRTKIKLGPSNSHSDRANQSMISPKSSSSAIDESDDGTEIESSHTQSYPKITIKPIVKPPSFESDYQTHHHHSHHHHSHQHQHPNSNSLSNSHVVASVSSTPQEGIPKLIITGNHQNYQKHIVSTESNIVPKLTASLGGSTSNLSIGSNSHDDDDSYADEMDGRSATELVPKLTIKLDNNHQHQSNVNDLTRKEVSLVSNDGVKVTLKPIAEPPIPKFTIKTNAFNDTAKLIMVNNAATNNEQTDESSDEQPSQPASCQPSPNDKAHAISSTSLNLSYMGQTAEDNLSTCSFGSSSSYSSSSSTTTPNNDIKLIIKATSTGSCVVSPNSLSIARNSPSSTSTKNSVCTTPKIIFKSNNSEQSKLNNLASSIVSSSTSSSSSSSSSSSTAAAAAAVTATTSANSSNDNNAIPKLNIKLSGIGEYPQVIHNNDMETTKLEQTNRTGSPLPKFTIRKTGTGDENIIIPKVTIKPVVKPNENADAMNAEAPLLVTPKIILKPIPKPIDKPLEINTGAAPGSPFKCSADMESQQSPRIILKINKNTMSQANETNALTSTTIITTDEPHSIDSSSVAINHQQNDLKRGANYDNDFQAKKSKLDAEIVLSSDSEFDETDRATDATTSIRNQMNNHNDSTAKMAAQQTNVIMRSTSETTAAAAPSSFDSNSGLRSILSRPQMKIQPQPLQTFLKALPPFKSVTTADNKTNDVIDLCHDSNDQLMNEDQSNDEMILSADMIETNRIDATETNVTVTEPLRPIQPKTNSGFNWQCFYNEGNEQNDPTHPLVRQNIERTNVLAALMEAERNKEKSTNGNTNNNNSTAKESLDGRLNAATQGNHSLLLENDGSSSDCIVVEDTASEPFPTMDYGRGENTFDQNGRKKESMDRDSGVEVSNSVKSISEDGTGTTPVAKRPRGRPRKSTATPKATTKKQKSAAELSKRKFAGVLMPKHNAQIDVKPENSIILGTEQITSSTFSTKSTSESSMPQTTSELITSSTMPTMSQDLIECKEEKVILSVAPTISQENTMEAPSISSSPTLPNNTESVMDASTSLSTSNQLEILNALTPSSSHVNDGESPSASVSLTIPTTPTTALISGISKERKRRIVVDDDDESPTFNPLSSRSSGKKARGKNRRGKGGLLKQKQRQMIFTTPDKANESALFTSPESIDRRKLQAKDAVTPALQVFEEDTRMSADSNMTSPTVRTTEFLQNEESQSSLHSSASATVESSAKKFRSKIEVVDPEGRTEFTADMIAEYDWPPPKGCCPSRNRDTFMIQEQIAEYLGVKSFKRKYPDLPRRMVEMEERNYLMERGLVSEKMCDLGLTAVLASDVLDIMHSDFYDKFDEYRRYLREKQVREISARQKQMQSGTMNKSMSTRDSAMRSASMWNNDFNRSRVESRRECIDLQNLVVQIPERPSSKTRQAPKPSNYPVALVPGQFQEYYRTYSAAELLCYPLNTVLADPHDLDRKLREYYEEVRKSRCINDDSDSDSDSSSSSDSDSDSDSSDSSDESSDSSEDDKPLSQIKPIIDDKPKEKPIPKVAKADRNKCYVCKGLERCNSHQKPELFISCTRCDRNAHPTCLKMSSRTVRRINEYAWHCRDCQICIKCRTGDNEDKMMYCNQCDRCYHIYCIGLRKVPNGKWHCAVCTVCTMCGARRPEGHNNPNLTPQQKQKLLAVAKWTHEYEENPLNKEQEHVAMLCTSCLAVKNSASKSKLYFS